MKHINDLVKAMYDYYRDVPQGSLSDEQYELNALLRLSHAVHEDHLYTQASNTARNGLLWYCFVSPDGGNAVQVFVKDFPAFVREHGLSLEEMEKVGNGFIREHRGWKRALKVGAIGNVYREPRPLPEEITSPRVRREAVEEQKRWSLIKQSKKEKPIQELPQSTTYRPGENK